MSIFTCCEREDETKYLHTCGCPTASFTCESEEISANLCGFEEPSEFVSSPPLKYLILTSVGSGTLNGYFPDLSGCDRCSGRLQVQTIFSGSGTITYSSVDCSQTTSGSAQRVDNSWTCERDYSVPGCGADAYSTVAHSGNGVQSDIRNTPRWNGVPQSSTVRVATPAQSQPELILTNTLSGEDTEENAIARGTPVSGTSCSSLWSTRSTGFSWVKRTSGYTIECDDLVVGVEYEVKPAIRKRTAVIGSFGAWEDVTVTPVTFTATATTKTIDQSGEPIPLDHIQGYEYEITAVSIEKTA